MKRVILYALTFILVTVMSPSALLAEVKLPSIFGDNMVLQQQSQAALWGYAAKIGPVKVITSWNQKTYMTTSGHDGKWKLKINTPSAGGPYEITISDGTTLKLRNILIGEVWICAGQSNMVMPMKGYLNQPVLSSNEIIATSENPSIRLFTVKTATSLQPLFTGSWISCEPENVREFSATAYFFGRLLNKVLNVPVGLICASAGGTRVECWMSEKATKEFQRAGALASTYQGGLSYETPTILYDAMINPMVGYGMRGVIWYQGEANRNAPDKYQQLLPGLINDWRLAWGIGDFPFYYVQIAPFDYGSNDHGPKPLNSAYLREAQLKVSGKVANVGMASAMDVGEKDGIHPANKEATSTRLAYLALIKTYGKTGFGCSGPVLKEMTVNGKFVNLSFENAPNGLTSFGKELSCFEVAGKDKMFFPAMAYITPNANITGNDTAGVTVFSRYVDEPVSVRYAFKDFVAGDLFNTEGLPASSFRTDNWEMK